MVAFLEGESVSGIRQSTMTANFFRTALLTPKHGEGARKGALNNCLLQTLWPVNRDQRGSLLAVEHDEKRQK